MPEARLEFSKLHNSYTVTPNDAWMGSLESSHPYLQPRKVSKTPKIESTHKSLPKIAKSHFDCLRTLGVNICVPIKTPNKFGMEGVYGIPI
jgi:hypothetical protein